MIVAHYYTIILMHKLNYLRTNYSRRTNSLTNAVKISYHETIINILYLVIHYGTYKLFIVFNNL
jgi:hypothetical protein